MVVDCHINSQIAYTYVYSIEKTLNVSLYRKHEAVLWGMYLSRGKKRILSNATFILDDVPFGSQEAYFSHMNHKSHTQIQPNALLSQRRDVSFMLLKLGIFHAVVKMESTK